MPTSKPKGSNREIIAAAYRVARALRATTIFVSLDPLKELPERTPKPRLVFVTQRTAEELAQKWGSLKHPVIQLPKVDMTRMGQIKMAVVLGLSSKMISLAEKVVFVTGLPGRDFLDSVVCLDTAKETEILATPGLNNLSEDVKPEVFEEVLGIALELASRGREGKPVGALFVLGDEEKVLQLSRQMIINPFKGYTNEERNILNLKLKETLREFAALDGAIVISEEGLVLSAGRHLGAAGDAESLPRGLGARHVAAAGITALTKAVAIVISESSGDVRIFKNGKILMAIEKSIPPVPVS